MILKGSKRFFFSCAQEREVPQCLQCSEGGGGGRSLGGAGKEDKREKKKRERAEKLTLSFRPGKVACRHVWRKGKREGGVGRHRKGMKREAMKRSILNLRGRHKEEGSKEKKRGTSRFDRGVGDEEVLRKGKGVFETSWRKG